MASSIVFFDEMETKTKKTQQFHPYRLGDPLGDVDLRADARHAHVGRIWQDGRAAEAAEAGWCFFFFG